jgi:HK97 family phage prohead protease
MLTRADAEDLSESDMVHWDSSGGTAYGVIETKETNGAIEAQPEGPTMEGTEDNPAFLVRVWDLEDDERQETDVLVVHRAEALMRIEEFPDSRSATDERAETDAELFNLAGVVAQKLSVDVGVVLKAFETLRERATHGDEDEKNGEDGEDEKTFFGHSLERRFTELSDLMGGAGTKHRHASIPVRIWETEEDRQSGTITVEINNDDIDRHGTVVMPSGARTHNFEQNPVVMWQHGHGVAGSVPIGRAESIRTEDNALFAQVRFDENDSFAREIRRKVEEGFVNAASIGFRPSNQRSDTIDGEQVTVVDEWELVEFSMVSVPSNPSALVESRNYINTIAQRVADTVTEKIQRRKIYENQEEQEDSAPASPSADSEESRDGAESAAEGDAGEECGSENRQRLSDREALSLMMEAANDHIDRVTGRK